MLIPLILIAVAGIILFFLRGGHFRGSTCPPALNKNLLSPDMASFFKDPVGAVQLSQNRGESVFSCMFTPTKRWHVIHDRKLFKPFFQANEDVLSFEASVPIFFAHMFGDNPMGDKDGVADWSTVMKKIITSGMWRANQLDHFENIMHSTADSFLKRWDRYAESGEWFDLAEEVDRFTSAINFRVMFGEVAYENYVQQWQHLFPELDRLASAQEVIVAPWVPFGKAKKFWEVKKQVYNICYEVWDNMCEWVSEKYQGIEEQRSILFDSYAELVCYTYKDKMPKQLISDHIVGIDFAAHVNTSNALVWMTCLLLKHPEEMKRIVREIDGESPIVVEEGSSINNSTSAEDSGAAMSGNYATACFREANRLYPQIAMLRIVMNDMKIPGTEYHVKKGDVCCVTPVKAHRDAEFFAEPDAFKPERFYNQEATKAMLNGLSYVAFGSGAHRCLGEKFVLRVAKAWTKGVFSRYHLELKDPNLPGTSYTTISDPAPSTPVYVRLTPRK